MPRAGWVKPESSRRLSDVVSVGVVRKVFPADVVDEVIAECGRREQRHRSLPAQTMAYFAIGLALHAWECQPGLAPPCSPGRALPLQVGPDQLSTPTCGWFV
jgi:hypothetical protein